MNGVINVLKPPGMTSSDVVVFLRRLLNIKKVGHTGTLDPDAAGVLPICIGKATRISDYIMHQDKVYRCEVKLGLETDTADISGKIISRTDSYPDFNSLTEAIASFQGDIEQIPPMHSAIKVNGKKLYELARQGIELEVAPRKISIYSIKIMNYAPPDTFMLEVICSKGTYIRALCRDIGRYLGCGAVMSFLLRYRTGYFSLPQSLTLDEIKTAHENGTAADFIIPMESALKEVLPQVYLKDDCMAKLCNGNKIDISNITNMSENVGNNPFFSVICGTTFIGIGCFDDSSRYVRMKNVLI